MLVTTIGTRYTKNTSMPKKTNKKIASPSPAILNLDSSLLIGGIIIVLALVATLLLRNTNLFELASKTILNITHQPPVVSEIDPDSRIVYVRDPDFDIENDLEAVLITPDGSESQVLTIPNLRKAFKHPQSQLVFFTTNTTDNEFHVLNLEDNTTTSYSIPIVHPDPKAFTVANGLTLQHISPDGSALIQEVFFREDCPPMNFPPGFQGGSGPCQPDEDENTPPGLYYYDLIDNSTTYLGQTISSVYWRLEEDSLYFVDLEYENAGLKKLDVITKEISMVDAATSFGYGGYLLTDGTTLIRASGGTGEGISSETYSRLAVVDVASATETIFDKGQWADIQPIFSVSPNERYIVYARTPLNQGLVTGQLHVHDLETGETYQLTKTDSSLNYSQRVVWVDDDSFVTTINEVDPQHFDNRKTNLILFDLDTQTYVTLTDTTNVVQLTE